MDYLRWRNGLFPICNWGMKDRLDGSDDEWR
jgi:hypothetical protein